MTEKGWFARKSPPLVEASTAIGERQQDGTVRPSPFKDLPPRDVPQVLSQKGLAGLAALYTGTPDQTAETEIDLVPTAYQALTLRAGGCLSCIFVPANGKPFGRSYSFLQGVDWLRDGTEGFALMYNGSSVEIRGRGLWPVFLAINDHRAYAVHQFNPDTWQLPRSGPVVTHIAPKIPPALRQRLQDGRKGDEQPGTSQESSL